MPQLPNDAPKPQTAEEYHRYFRSITFFSDIETFFKNEENKTHLNEAIKNSKDFYKIVSPYHNEPIQQSIARGIVNETYQAIRPRLADLVKTPDDFYNIFSNQYLDEKHCVAFYNESKEKLHGSVETLDDFISVFRLLPADQKIECYHALKQKLHELVDTSNDVYHILWLLPKEQRNEFYETLKEKFPHLEFIKTQEDIDRILRVSTPEQIEDVFSILARENRLTTIIENMEGFIWVLKNIDSSRILQAIQLEVRDETSTKPISTYLKTLTDKIQTIEDLKNIFTHTPPTDQSSTSDDNNHKEIAKNISIYLKLFPSETSTLISDVASLETFLFFLKQQLPHYNDDFLTILEVLFTKVLQVEKLEKIINTDSDAQRILTAIDTQCNLYKDEPDREEIKNCLDNALSQKFKKLDEKLQQKSESLFSPSLTDQEKNRIIFSLSKDTRPLDLLTQHGEKSHKLREDLSKYASEHKDDPALAKAFVMLSLKLYCDRISKIEKKDGAYKDFQLFADSRTRSRDINLELAKKLIESLEKGDTLENFKEYKIQTSRNEIKNEKPESRGPLERKGVWSAELNKIFKFARESTQLQEQQLLQAHTSQPPRKNN